MTRRADLRDDREEALRELGLVPSDLRVGEYLPAGTMGGLSDEQLGEAVEMAGLGAFERAIARVLGVDEKVFMSTLHKGKRGESKRYADFAQRFYAARKEHMKRQLRVVDDAAAEGDWKPAAWQLERSFGFTKQETIEHEVAPQTLSLMALAQIPLEDARAIIEAEAVEVNDDLPPAA